MKAFLLRNSKWILLKIAGLLVLLSILISPPALIMKFLWLGAGLFLFGSWIAFAQEKW